MGDFDIGPEEAGMMLGIAEEMAEEERALRDELELQREALDNNDDDCPAGPVTRRNQPSKAQQRPFERYVDEVIFGQREHGDTSGLFEAGVDWESYDFDPETGTASVDIQNIHVQNAHLVSTKFLVFISIATGMYGCGARTINFRKDGQPVVNSRQVFGTYDAVKKSIVINLKRHFDNAKLLAGFAHNHFCIHAMIWHSMLVGFLHELYHSITIEQGRGGNPDYRAGEEKAADRWSEVELVKLAVRFDLERPPISKDHFFGPGIQDLLKSPPEGAREGWSEHQKTMIDKGLVYENPVEQVVVQSLKEFVRIAGCATHDNVQYAHAAWVLKSENEATDEFFNKVRKEADSLN